MEKQGNVAGEYGTEGDVLDDVLSRRYIWMDGGILYKHYLDEILQIVLNYLWEILFQFYGILVSNLHKCQLCWGIVLGSSLIC